MFAAKHPSPPAPFFSDSEKLYLEALLTELDVSGVFFKQIIKDIFRGGEIISWRENTEGVSQTKVVRSGCLKAMS